MTEVALRAPAKVNLFLRVLARETSGFHCLETLFLALDLHDRIVVRRRKEEGVVLEVEGDEDLGPSDRNLAVRAARAYRKRAREGAEGDRGGGRGGVRIQLRKTIPAGAGLGGGSSDAAAVLRAMNRLDGRLEGRDLLRIARSLGADVPYFLAARPLALGWGRGDRLLALPSLPSRPAVVVVPEGRIATADAYAALAKRRNGREAGPPGARVLRAADLDSWERTAALAENDFEAVAFEMRPICRRARDLLVSEGAAPALLAGSGSAVFGIFRRKAAADRAASRALDALPGCIVHRTHTLERWPAP